MNSGIATLKSVCAANNNYYYYYTIYHGRKGYGEETAVVKTWRQCVTVGDNLFFLEGSRGGPVLSKRGGDISPPRSGAAGRYGSQSLWPWPVKTNNWRTRARVRFRRAATVIKKKIQFVVVVVVVINNILVRRVRLSTTHTLETLPVGQSAPHPVTVSSGQIVRDENPYERPSQDV